MNNADYWARRLKIMEDALKDQSYEYVKNLEQQFDAAIAQIDTQMRAWYQRFADNNGGISYAEAQKLLTAGELKEFKWTVQQYIKAGKEHAISGAWAKELENASARVHISRLESLKIQLRQQAEALTQARVKATTDASELSYTQSYYHTAFEVQRGLGVGWTMQALNSGTVQKVLSRPWTVDNQTFTARCWTDKTKLVETVNQELTRMLATGEAPDKAIAAISKRFNVSKQNAGRVVMTESAYFSSAAQKDCFNELGVEKYRIIGTLDTKTCNICGDMDGKVFKMSDYRPGSTAPPFHPWCRKSSETRNECFQRFVVVLFRAVNVRFALIPAHAPYVVPLERVNDAVKTLAVFFPYKTFVASGIANLFVFGICLFVHPRFGYRSADCVYYKPDGTVQFFLHFFAEDIAHGGEILYRRNVRTVPYGRLFERFCRLLVEFGGKRKQSDIIVFTFGFACI